MAAFTQKEKQRIDVGEKGDANTGDIIFDGGEKLNRTLDNLYNAFGDQRLYGIGLGDNLQTIHATGYYQKLPANQYAGKIDLGTMHDLDTTTGTLVVNLPTPKLGEQVKFINSNGSFSIANKAILTCEGGSSIAGKNTLDLIQPFSMVTLTCVNEIGATKLWDYKMEPMFGDFSVPIDTSAEITQGATTSIELFNKNSYTGSKLVISAKEVGTDDVQMTMSEILLMIDADQDKIYSDEYSVLFKDEKIFNIDFKITDGKCIADVTTAKPRIHFAIKTIETIKAG